MFRCFDDPTDDRRLAEPLVADRVCVAVRYTAGVSGIRVSTRHFDNEEDLARLAWAVERALGR